MDCPPSDKGDKEKEDAMSTSSDSPCPQSLTDLQVPVGDDAQRDREEKELDLQMKITRGINELQLMQQEGEHQIKSTYTTTTHSSYTSIQEHRDSGDNESASATHSATRHSPSPPPPTTTTTTTPATANTKTAWDPLSTCGPVSHAASPPKPVLTSSPSYKPPPSTVDRRYLHNVGSQRSGSPALRKPPGISTAQRRTQTPPPCNKIASGRPHMPSGSRQQSLQRTGTPPPTSGSRSPSPACPWVERLYPHQKTGCPSPSLHDHTEGGSPNESNQTSSPSQKSSTSTSATPSSIFNKLYSNGMNQKAKRDRIVVIEQQRRQFVSDQKFKEHCTFRPEISSAAKTAYEKLQAQMKLNEMNNNNHNNHNNNMNNDTNVPNLNDPLDVVYRLTQMDPKRKAKTQRDLQRRHNDKLKKECPFTPNKGEKEESNGGSNSSSMNLSRNTSKLGTPGKKKDELFNRLYRDAKNKEKRLVHQQRKALELEEQAIKVSHMRENWRYAEKILAGEEPSFNSPNPK